MIAAGVALACGAGALLEGYFDLTTWGWIAVAAAALAAGLLIARGPVLRGPALVAIVGLTAFALWSLVSTSWAESADAALIEGDRWLLYTAALTGLCLLVRTEGGSRLLVAALTAGALVGVTVVAIRLFTEGSDLFLAARLNDPLGYVNGQAAYLIVPLWPLIAVAERTSRPYLGGVAVAAAAACAALSLLAQSRGAVLALVASTVLLLALVPGRVRRLWIVLAIGAFLVLLALGPYGELYDLGSKQPGDELTSDAAGEALLWSAALGVAWALASAVWAPLARTLGPRAARGLSLAAVAAVALVAAVTLTVKFDPVRDYVSDTYDSFTSLEGTGVASTRLVSGGGNRYDYWRVAWEQFQDEPLKGFGAGNYDAFYYRERRNDEEVRQAHSLELQALGETGVVGGLAIAIAFGAVLWAIWARGRGGTRSPAPGLAVAAGGVFLLWFAQTSVDWLHLIPGLTGGALVAVATLMQPWAAGERVFDSGRLRAAWAAVIALAAAAAVVLVVRPVLAERYLDQGVGELPDDPRAALDDAEQALEQNSQGVDAYYLAAAAYARANDYAQSRDALRRAIDLEPHDFVSWVLLGDLQARRGDIGAARRSYRRALELNPREQAIEQLVERPPFSGRR